MIIHKSKINLKRKQKVKKKLNIEGLAIPRNQYNQLYTEKHFVTYHALKLNKSWREN